MYAPNELNLTNLLCFVQDNEGQTALHYAVVCEREYIAELLVKHHADLEIKDEDGNTARDLCPSSWSFMNQAN